jgi:hypothetical protein
MLTSAPNLLSSAADGSVTKMPSSTAMIMEFVIADTS